MPRSPKIKSRSVLLAEMMPPFKRHSVTQPFDIRRSEVVQWLIEQPEILQAVFDFYRERGAIVYNPLTKTWAGAHFQNPPHTPPASQESARS